MRVCGSLPRYLISINRTIIIIIVLDWPGLPSHAGRRPSLLLDARRRFPSIYIQVE